MCRQFNPLAVYIVLLFGTVGLTVGLLTHAAVLGLAAGLAAGLLLVVAATISQLK